MSDLSPRTRKGRRRQTRAVRADRIPPRLLSVEATLVGTDPAVTRTFELASSLSLAELHDVLQAAFEWEHAHLHDFRAGTRTWQPGAAAREAPMLGAPSEPEEHTRLLEVLGQPRDTVVYTYDFGDTWTHLVTTTAVSPLPDDAPLARLLAAASAAPFEDCGGIPGWENILAALATDGPDPEGLREWAAEMYGDLSGFDPRHVDIERLAHRVATAVRR